MQANAGLIITDAPNAEVSDGGGHQARRTCKRVPPAAIRSTEKLNEAAARGGRFRA